MTKKRKVDFFGFPLPPAGSAAEALRRSLEGDPAYNFDSLPMNEETRARAASMNEAEKAAEYNKLISNPLFYGLVLQEDARADHVRELGADLSKCPSEKLLNHMSRM